MKFNKSHLSRRNFLKHGSLALPFVLFPQTLSALLLKEQFVHRTAFAMGTTVSIQAYHTDRMLAQNAISKAFDELFRLDNLLSIYKKESDISSINISAGKNQIRVHPTVIDILQRAIDYSKETNGVFDCTIEPLMKLWGFRNTVATKIPSVREIQFTIDAVGYRNIVIDEKENSVGLLNKQSSIDLGGIAVGYTTDRMVDILKREGILSALINHSGDIFAIGEPPETNGWKVGIPSPLYPSEFVTVLSLQDQSISTSGSYNKFVEIEEQRFSHILHGITGKPANQNLSVSVVSHSSLVSDVLSTTFFCEYPTTIKAGNIGPKLEVIVVDKQQNVIQQKL